MRSVCAARPIAATLALLNWTALLLQLWLALQAGRVQGQSVSLILTNFFSFFTILTNLFAAGILTWTALAPKSPPPGLRTSAAVYMAVVGLGYSLLLRHLWQPQGLQKLVDVLLHDIHPVAYVAFWLSFFRKGTALSWQSVFRWLIWPLIYLLYSMARGSLIGWYPYPFLDPNVVPLPRIISTIAGFMGTFLVLGLAAVALTRKDSLQTLSS